MNRSAPQHSLVHLLAQDWRSVLESTGYKGPAVYAVRLLDNGVVVPIDRFLDTDYNGVLTIGMTTNLDRRRSGFVRGYTKGRGHSAANLLFALKLCEAYGRRFKAPSFEIAFEPIADEADARQREAKLIREYFERFGEIPPLSSAIPNKYVHLEQHQPNNPGLAT